MKIDWIEYEMKDHPLAWFLVEAMSRSGIKKFGKIDSKNLDVVLTVNGIEVPIVEVMDYLNSQLNYIENRGFEKGKNEARNLIQDNIDKILSIDESEL